MTFTPKSPAIPSVESQPCSSGGLHTLAWCRGVIRCKGCEVGWAELDAVARSTYTPPKTQRGRKPVVVRSA